MERNYVKATRSLFQRTFSLFFEQGQYFTDPLPFASFFFCSSVCMHLARSDSFSFSKEASGWFIRRIRFALVKLQPERI